MWISGAEMFAKRRKKCEQWIVDENNVKNSNGYPNQFQQQTPTTPQPPPTYLQNSHVRTENIQRMNEIQVKQYTSIHFVEKRTLVHGGKILRRATFVEFGRKIGRVNGGKFSLLA